MAKICYTDTLEDLKWQLAIASRAAYSLAILGMAFVKHGSGRFVGIYSDNFRGRIPRLKKLVKQAERRQERLRRSSGEQRTSEAEQVNS